jgi:hypothetical protein
MPDAAAMIVAEQPVQMARQLRALSLRAESFNPETRTLDVVASAGTRRATFDWNSWREIDEELEVSPAAIRMDRLNNGAPVLNTHRAEELEDQIGVVVPGSARIENGQLIATVQLSAREEIAGIVGDIQAGLIRNISVGYIVHAYDVTETPGSRPLYRAVDWEPAEISFVPVPADPAAGVRSADAEQGRFPCIIRRAAEIGPAIPEAQDMSNTPEAAAPAAVAPAPAPAAIATTEQRAAAPAITASAIITACRNAGLADTVRDEIIARHEAAPLNNAELMAEIGQQFAQRNAAPTRSTVTVSVDESVKIRAAMETALLHRANPAAHRLENGAEEFRGLSLLEMGSELVARQGGSVRGLDKMERAAVILGIRAGGGMHSTSDFPLLLANIANKSLRAAYEAAPRTFTAFCRETSLNDFKSVSRVSLGDAPALLPVSEHGEFTRGTVGETAENYALATFGRVVAVSRQAIVNDDMDAFTRIPGLFGRAAADLESDTVWNIIMTNPNMADAAALFNTTFGNLAASGTAIGVTSLGVARSAMRKFVNLAGRPMNVQARYLWCGPDTELAADQVLASVTPQQASNVNPFSGTLVKVVDPRVTGTIWGLAADPSAIDTIEYAYLSGQQGVFTETRTGFDVDGLEIKARLDFGAKAIDRRGLYRNPGA